MRRIGRFVDAEHDRAAQGGVAENNICGVLVHARPEQAGAVRAALAAMPGVEIHHAEPDGRMVVTIEDAPGRWAGATLTSFQDVPGLVSAILVYHHSEPDGVPPQPDTCKQEMVQ